MKGLTLKICFLLLLHFGIFAKAGSWVAMSGKNVSAYGLSTESIISFKNISPSPRSGNIKMISFFSLGKEKYGFGLQFKGQKKIMSFQGNSTHTTGGEGEIVTGESFFGGTYYRIVFSSKNFNNTQSVLRSLFSKALLLKIPKSVLNNLKKHLEKDLTTAAFIAPIDSAIDLSYT